MIRRQKLTGPVIPVMEHGDVPVRLHAGQEFTERTWTFGEFCKAISALTDSCDSPNRMTRSSLTPLRPPTMCLTWLFANSFSLRSRASIPSSANAFVICASSCARAAGVGPEAADGLESKKNERMTNALVSLEYRYENSVVARGVMSECSLMKLETLSGAFDRRHTFTYAPGFSGIRTLMRTSRRSPSSARSATNLSLLKFMFPPEMTATKRLPAPTKLLRVMCALSPARASAPDGSGTERVSTVSEALK